MISPASIVGIPRPVGSAFRQRTVYADHEGRHVPWIVSVVDTVRGPVVEARRHFAVSAIVGSDLDGHSMIGSYDVLAQTLKVLDEDGWKTHTVKKCSVPQCANPMALYAHSLSGNRPEQQCLACQARTVLACVECGAPDTGEWVGREALLRDQLCLHCFHWRQTLAEAPDRRTSRHPRVITDSWEIYSIGTGSGSREHRGFGGHGWIVRFYDGTEVETSDLWAGGRIPVWFRDRFTPNAEVIDATTLRPFSTRGTA